ncbi:MAG: response regulator transcription factor [Anaerolineales bacterium]
MIRALIADDHAVVRQGLRQILLETTDMVVTGEAANGPEALERARSGGYDVVVLDITMPGRSGFEVLKELRLEDPALPVLVLSMHSEEQFAVRLLKAGASGYLNKESAPEELVKAIRKVVSGGRYVSPRLAEKLAFEIDSGSDKLLHETLSDREFQVMRMMASGQTVKEIAAELTLSVKTISTYRARILDKMNLHTNAELIHYAIQNQLIE